jgi:hypothetical protein
MYHGYAIPVSAEAHCTVGRYEKYGVFGKSYWKL